MAMLSQYDFESFEEKQDHMLAYISTESYLSQKKEINALLDEMNFTYTWIELDDQNWNEVWESNFEPVNVENICRIRAEFHEHDNSFPYEIIIQPKMAFGTGHHQTTCSMIKKMNELDFKNKIVFDYGCGTGVLAIFASMLKAASIDALDIEEESFLNTVENAERNNTPNVQAYHGTIEKMKGKSYDIVLANINRNVLLDSATGLQLLLKNQGTLLLSGILSEDFSVIKECYVKNNFEYVDHIEKENWLCVKFIRL